MLFIALLQCSVAFSATDATTPVPLYYYKYNPPVVDGTNGPRKNPPHQLTLSVLFDHDRVYVVSYSVNSELIDQKKVRLD